MQRWLSFATIDLILVAVFAMPAAANDQNTCAKASGDEAIAACSRVIGSGVKGADASRAFLNRGVEYVAKGDLDHAIADYDEAIRLDPKFVNAYYRRGNSYYSKGDYDRAIADYDEAIRLDPKYANA